MSRGSFTIAYDGPFDLNATFSKGDILICDVNVTQKNTRSGLKTDYVVEKVVQHIPAARQLPLPIDDAGNEPGRPPAGA